MNWLRDWRRARRLGMSVREWRWWADSEARLADARAIVETW